MAEQNTDETWKISIKKAGDHPNVIKIRIQRAKTANLGFHQKMGAPFLFCNNLKDPPWF